MASRPPNYGWCPGTMIGFVPRARPVITVERYDDKRRLMVESCDRQKILKAIAEHLRLNELRGGSLKQLYAGVGRA